MHRLAPLALIAAVHLSIVGTSCRAAPDPDPSATEPTAVDPPGPRVRQQELAHAPVRPPRTTGHPALSSALRDLAHAATQGAAVLRAHLARADRTGREMSADGAILVEISLVDGSAPAEFPEETLTQHGARLRVRGHDRLEAWVPPEALNSLAASHPDIAWVDLPRRPYPTLGAVTSQGVALTGAERFHCRAASGTGVHVAVVDTGFAGLAASLEAGELGEIAGDPPAGQNNHGTACSEIVFDMAPGVTLHPVTVGSLAELQAFVDGLPETEIQVISDSLVWVGDSFSDNTGPHCDVVEAARQAGVAWVTSAGNNGRGTFYTSTFVDENGDGQHEFADGDELNELSLSAGATVAIELDWDAYPATDQDYDLYLYRLEGDTPVEVASSIEEQAGAAPPRETILYTVPAAGTYGVSVVRASATEDDMRLRLFLFPAPGLQLEHWQAEASLADPAHCEGALTVGAAPQADYEEGGVWVHSSQGPTNDAEPRIKPDLLAPSAVRTSVFSSFQGTSAASPHAAAAIALYVGAAGLAPLDAVQAVIEDAHAMGDPVPNSTTGWGRIDLDGDKAGWLCAPESEGPCDTPCGTIGEGICGEACVWAVCTPPTEVCNGVDDDCDGALPPEEADRDDDGVPACLGDCDDDDSAVFPGAEERCNGVDDDCDEAVPADEVDSDDDGVLLCADDCDDNDSAVFPGAEERCNGVDDNCDGEVPLDEVDGDGDQVSICAGDCDDDDATRAPGADEVCDGIDNDCDTSIDEGCPCGPGEERACPGDAVGSCSPGTQRCEAGAWSEVCEGRVEPTDEVCGDGQDNNCDGAVDEGCEPPPAGSGGDIPPRGCACGAAQSSPWRAGWFLAIFLGAVRRRKATTRRRAR